MTNTETATTAARLDTPAPCPARPTTRTITLTKRQAEIAGTARVIELPALSDKLMEGARYGGNFADVAELHLQLHHALRLLHGNTARARNYRRHTPLADILRGIAFHQMRVDIAAERVAAGRSPRYRPIP